MKRVLGAALCWYLQAHKPAMVTHTRAAVTSVGVEGFDEHVVCCVRCGARLGD